MRSSVIKTRQPTALTLELAGEFVAQSSLIVLFAPTRTRVRSVTLEGAPFEPVPGFAGFVWHFHSPRRLEHEERILVNSTGDAPSLLQFTAFEPEVDAHDPELLTLLVQSALKRLLDERGALAGSHEDPDNKLRGFFFRYDAWSQPLLSKSLIDYTFEKSLSSAAHDVFYKGMSDVAEIPSDVYGPLTRDLCTLYRCRARDFHTGRRGYDVLSYLDDPAAFLANIEIVAPYQERLFESEFKGCTSMRPMALVALGKALSRFAAGRLHFNAVPDPTLPPEVSPLNAEPDSILFLAFTEFSIHASNQSKSHKEFWFAMARTFAGLIEPFALVYGDPSYRAPCKYQPSNRRPNRVVDDDVEARLDVLEQRMPNSLMLVNQLEPFYAAAALAAMHDEITAPLSVCHP